MCSEREVAEVGRRHRHRTVLVVTMLACALPALMTPFPPAADLPQHLAQVEQALFGDLDPGAYVAWWAPNNLVYLPVAALRVVIGSEHLPSATIGLLGVLWAGATCRLGARLQRPPGAVALASVLFFNLTLNWGMLNFLLGWPLLLSWLAANVPLGGTVSAGSQAAPTFFAGATSGKWLLRIALGWLLLWAHALCFAAACASACVLILSGKSRPAETRADREPDEASTGRGDSPAVRLAYRALVQRLHPLFPLIPTGLYAVVWVMTLGNQRAARGFDVAAHYAMSFADRLDPEYLISRSVAAGPITFAFFGVLVGWVVAGFVRPSQGRRWDRTLVACAGLLALGYFALPTKYLNTIEFSSRWLPCMWMLLVLASPGPPTSERTATLAAGGATLLVSVSVGWSWVAFTKSELSGLLAALAATPPKAKLIGLDFLKYSPLVEGRPFLHLGSYATLRSGASTNFDFSEHGTALIRGAHRATPWTRGLEWFPERVRSSDFGHFDVALVGAAPDYHERVIARLPGLTALTESGVWRLYNLEATAPPDPGERRAAPVASAPTAHAPGATVSARTGVLGPAAVSPSADLGATSERPSSGK